MRVLKVFAKILGGILALYLILYAFRYQTTLPIDGVVVDAKTGKPVSKVLVRAYWHFSQSNLVDTTGAEKGFGTVTDENGRFRIPRKNVTIVLGSFNDLNLLVKHPLYDFDRIQIFSQMKHGYQLGKVEGRVLKLTLSITSLEDRYSKPDDNEVLARVIDDCGPDFYIAMRDSYKTKYDLKAIMTQLEGLTKRFPPVDGKYDFAYRSYKAHEFKMKELLEDY